MKNIILAATLLAATSTAVAEDRFAEVRGQLMMCAACHGAQGQGGLGPKLNGQSADDLITKLLKYKAGETVGPQSALMWANAKALTEAEIGTIAVYFQEGMPNE